LRHFWLLPSKPRFPDYLRFDQRQRRQPLGVARSARGHRSRSARGTESLQTLSAGGLEEDGFEASVPPRKKWAFRGAPHSILRHWASTRRHPSWRGTKSSNPSSSSGESVANSIWPKTALPMRLPPRLLGALLPSTPLSAGSPIRRWSLDRGSSATHQRSCGFDPRIRV